MKEIQGNLVKLAQAGEFDVIIHGCNCFCTMGAGIALTLKRTWPEVARIDRTTVSGDKEKLGTFTVARVMNNQGKLFSVINAYTQYGINGRGMREDLFEYEHFDTILRNVKQYYSGLRIGLPTIGSGHACGNWDRIRLSIHNELMGEDVTIVYFDK